MNKRNAIKRIAFVAAFGAISGILYCFVKFNLPIFPSFLDVNFSMIPIIICAFMLGPWDACVCVLLRFIVKLIPGSSTAFVGEVADIILGLTTAIACGCIYKYYNGKGKSLLSFGAVVAVWVVVSILINIFINIPFYINFFFDGNKAPLIGMCDSAFKLISFGNVSVTADNFMVCYVFLAVIPFNLMLSLIVVLITIPIHNRLKALYDMI
ncbi:MAG: ECF transporter S component [Erysipelotrichaceae bacterium]|nr:ECF transporter S component [Erysipelotrichaceae bacterium]